MEKEFEIKQRSTNITSLPTLRNEMQKPKQLNKLEKNIYVHPQEKVVEKNSPVDIITVKRNDE